MQRGTNLEIKQSTHHRLLLVEHALLLTIQHRVQPLGLKLPTCFTPHQAQVRRTVSKYQVFFLEDLIIYSTALYKAVVFNLPN